MVKNKKAFVLIFIFLILFSSNINVNADDEDEENVNEIELQQLVESDALPLQEPTINARAAVIYDRTTKQVIWGKNENEKRAMASTTKIMTAIIVIENSNLSDIITISPKAAGTEGSRLKINKGDKISVNDLLYGLMLRSRE